MKSCNCTLPYEQCCGAMSKAPYVAPPPCAPYQPAVPAVAPIEWDFIKDLERKQKALQDEIAKKKSETERTARLKAALEQLANALDDLRESL